MRPRSPAPERNDTAVVATGAGVSSFWFVKLTKQRKAFAAFLGLAAVAFVADRLFFLPAGAGAATLPQDAASHMAVAAPAASGAGKPVAVEVGVAPGPTLADKLVAATGDGATARNPFQQPWRGVSVSAAAAPETKAPGELATASEFAARHELRAVSKVNDTAVAVIGKVARRVGDTVDGWTVVSIEDRSATLERAGQRVTLALRGTMPDNAIVPRRAGQGGPEDPDQ